MLNVPRLQPPHILGQGQQPRGATPHLRLGAAARGTFPMPKAWGSGREEGLSRPPTRALGCFLGLFSAPASPHLDKVAWSVALVFPTAARKGGHSCRREVRWLPRR